MKRHGNEDSVHFISIEIDFYPVCLENEIFKTLSKIWSPRQ